jgi:hypothetical protein
MAALICREYGWTWDQYREQPTWFIKTIVSMLREEADESKRRNK